MEINLYIAAQFQSNKESKVIGEFLLEDTRPVLDDDVEDAAHVKWFNAIDEMEYPEAVEIIDNKLNISFFLGGHDVEEDIDIITKGLKKCGPEKLAFVIWDGEELCDLSNLQDGKFKPASNFDKSKFEKANDSDEIANIFDLLNSVL
ncbi:hypothetical protein [Pleionea mediterranea]|uniref:Uncharacterized protein n=1 Tax=Pleionea mediterranea TaxID=523701 RepID=A0A316FSK7_9GAMM|nr:hypothetical protein [Pleionea mediterranea]PWK51741.1 hypothetical protein C8D97_10556 [Pleionea mediterranea]